MCLSRALGLGEAEGTRGGAAEGMCGGAGRPGTATRRDLTCLFGLEACGTGGGGEATATRLYIAAPVNGLDTTAGSGDTAAGEVKDGPGAAGAVEVGAEEEVLDFLGRRRERLFLTSVNPEAEDSSKETFLSAAGGGAGARSLSTKGGGDGVTPPFMTLAMLSLVAFLTVSGW